MDKNILIISNKWDAHSDAVIREMQQHDMDVIRINTEDFRRNAMVFELSASVSRWHLITPENRIVSKESISGVYIRRLKMPIDTSDVDKQFQRFVSDESMAYFNAIETLLDDAIWLNRPHEREMASNKIRQLILAKKVGLMVPSTIVTNENDRASRFCSERSSVYKTLECPMLHFEDGRQSMINTTMVRPDMDFSGVNMAPAMFQHYVEKAYELRIHIIGVRIIPVKIDSQSHPDAIVDWRVAQKELHYELASIPEDIANKLLELMSELKIQFGIVDMVVTRGGEHVFLEINPDGNWLWIESKIQAKITEAIALYFIHKTGESP